MFWACEGLRDLVPDFGGQPVQFQTSGPAKQIAATDLISPSDPAAPAQPSAYLCKTHIRKGENLCPAADLSQTTHSVPAEYAETAITAELRSPSDCYHSEQYLLGWLIRLYGWRVMEPGVLRKCSRSAASRTESRPAQAVLRREVAA